MGSDEVEKADEAKATMPVSGEPGGSDSTRTDVPIDPTLHPMLRPFGTNAFFRLFTSMVSSSTGDWLWFLAVPITAARIGGGFTVSAALLARIAPAFFLAPIVGALVDRWDRKRVMMLCDTGRATMLLALPFVDSAWQLILVSLGLEIFTLFWAPAKEASVPNIVPRRFLANANSFSLGAAYGTIIPATVIFMVLGWIDRRVDDHEVLGLVVNQESLAYLVDAASFMFSVLIIWTLPFPKRHVKAAPKGERAAHVFRDVADGWKFTFTEPVVRAVNLGLALALMGGAVLVPLGLEFSTVVLGTTDGHGTLQTVFGLGAAFGVMSVAYLIRQITAVPKEQIFVLMLAAAGSLLFVTASTTTLLAAGIGAGTMGFAAGSMYVLGFTLLHERVSDELRGRAFGSLYTLIRLAVMTAFVLGPGLSEGIDRFTNSRWDRELGLWGWDVFVPGVRVTLWIAALVTIGASFVARSSLKIGQRSTVEVSVDPDVGDNGL